MKGLTESIRLIEDILDRINEAIRDREGRETLASVSKDLWIGQGYAILSNCRRGSLLSPDLVSR